MTEKGRRPNRPAPHRLAALVALAFLAAGPAAAQRADTGALIDRIERLQNELNTLQRYVYRGELPPKSAAAPQKAPDAADGGPKALARLHVRITGIEGEIRRLTGRNEEIDHRLTQIETRLEKLAGDLAFRLDRLEQGASAPGDMAADASPSETPRTAPSDSGGAPADGGAPPPVPGAEMGAKPLGALKGGTPPPQTAARPPPRDEPPARMYERAHNLIVNDRDFAQAETVLRAFIERHPDHALAPNAHYWLGRTFFVRSDFEQAAFAFAEGFQRFPKADKAPANLLNLGMALARLGKTREACTTFARLLEGYPDAPESVKRRLEREKSRAECG